MNNWKIRPGPYGRTVHRVGHETSRTVLLVPASYCLAAQDYLAVCALDCRAVTTPYYLVAPNCLVVATPNCLATRVCLYVSIPDFGFGFRHRPEQHRLGCIEASLISNILDS
jgi:hypothetical protein